jgi:hypothetical protein
MDGDTLLVVDVVNAHGAVVWAPAENIRFGRRVTRVESIKDQPQLLDRLLELVPLIAGDLPLRPPDAGPGDNVVVVDMAAPPAPAVEIAGPRPRRAAV